MLCIVPERPSSTDSGTEKPTGLTGSELPATVLALAGALAACAATGREPASNIEERLLKPCPDAAPPAVCPEEEGCWCSDLEAAAWAVLLAVLCLISLCLLLCFCTTYNKASWCRMYGMSLYMPELQTSVVNIAVCVKEAELACASCLQARGEVTLHWQGWTSLCRVGTACMQRPMVASEVATTEEVACLSIERSGSPRMLETVEELRLKPVS